MSPNSSISDFVTDSKLEVESFDEYIIQIRLLSNPATGQRRTRHPEKWQRTKKLLGSGSYGVVWLEECIAGPSSGEVRAVKELSKGTGVFTNYNRELEAIAKFSQEKYQDWFVRSFGWYENSNAIFITMEYLELGDLERYLKPSLSHAEARQIAQQLLEGLGFMHDNNFAHRDLKPANVLVVHQGPSWWVKIADFGITKRAIDSTNLGTNIGTVGYQAPEVWVFGTFNSQSDERDSYTFAVDIWAVGAITFRMITGQLPFPEGRLDKLVDYVRGNRPFPVEQSMSTECTDFVMKAMAASPIHRPTSQQALSHPWIEISISNDSDLHLMPRYEPNLMSTSNDSVSAQWSTLGEEFATLLIQNNALFDKKKASPPQNTTSFPGMSNTNSTNSSSAAAGMRWTSSTGPIDNPSFCNTTIKRPQKFAFSQELKVFSAEVFQIAFSPDGLQLASGGWETVRIWADRQGRLELVQELKGHSSNVSSVAFSPDGRRLASSGWDKTVRIWADRKGWLELVQELKGHGDEVPLVAFSPDGRRLASGGRVETVRIWADNQGRLDQVQELKDHRGYVSSIAFSPNGRQLASGSSDTIQIWADRQGRLELVQELKGHTSFVSSVAFSPDGQRLASGGKAETVLIWADKQGKLEQVQELKGHGDIFSVAFSPDGLQLASSSSDTIRIWADRQGKLELVQELKSYGGKFFSIAFSPDGRRLVSTGFDMKIRIWEVEK